MTLEQQIARATRVKAALDDGVLYEAIQELGDELTRAIIATAPQQVDERNALHSEYHALKRVVAKMHSWQDDALKAEAERAEQ